jgi:hypothetical protein
VTAYMWRVSQQCIYMCVCVYIYIYIYIVYMYMYVYDNSMYVCMYINQSNMYAGDICGRGCKDMRDIHRCMGKFGGNHR